MFFLSTVAFKGIFLLKRSLKKKKDGQVLNKPQMRLLLKISVSTFYQIQTDVYYESLPLVTWTKHSFWMTFIRGQCHSYMYAGVLQMNPPSDLRIIK